MCQTFDVMGGVKKKKKRLNQAKIGRSVLAVAVLAITASWALFSSKKFCKIF
jgi:hypothetical protein